ncbi:MAG: NAD(P)-binding domain-containing protein [Bacteroidales bacterium]|nr:NAD(P)-binding domain-containing protein [Bacteroidales bacterium]
MNEHKNRMIGVIGSGSWATALVKILLEKKGFSINWWVRNAEARQSLASTGHNSRRLSELYLDPSRLNLSGELAEIVSSSDLLLLAVPSAYLGQTLFSLSAKDYEGKRFVSAVKGTIPDCCMSISDYLEQVLHIAKENICVVSGPSHAEEVATGMATFLTVASTNNSFAKEVAEMLHCSYCHTSTTQDIVGIEHFVLAKNIYAIAAGICQGLGYGDNLNAVLTCAAIREIKVQLDKYLPLEGRHMDNYCYLGDLMVTCWSSHSRNRALGVAVAHGEKPQEVFERTGSVAEGYYSVKNMHTIYERLGNTDSIPISEAVYRVLYCDADPKSEMDYLIDHVF